MRSSKQFEQGQWTPRVTPFLDSMGRVSASKISTQMSFTFHSRPFALDQNRVQLGLGPMAPQGLTRGAIPRQGPRLG